MESQKPFIINEIVIGSYDYDEYHKKLRFYTTENKLQAEISMSKEQYLSIQESNKDEISIWNALADLFGDAEITVKRCPVCGRVPSIDYACGEYFVSGRENCRLCGDFSEMHSLKQLTIKAWNEAATDEQQCKCPLGDDEADDCADCVYSADYHFADGECVRR